MARQVKLSAILDLSKFSPQAVLMERQLNSIYSTMGKSSGFAANLNSLIVKATTFSSSMTKATAAVKNLVSAGSQLSSTSFGTLLSDKTFQNSGVSAALFAEKLKMVTSNMGQFLLLSKTSVDKSSVFVRLNEDIRKFGLYIQDVKSISPASFGSLVAAFKGVNNELDDIEKTGGLTVTQMNMLRSAAGNTSSAILELGGRLDTTQTSMVGVASKGLNLGQILSAVLKGVALAVTLAVGAFTAIVKIGQTVWKVFTDIVKVAVNIVTALINIASAAAKAVYSGLKLVYDILVKIISVPINAFLSIATSAFQSIQRILENTFGLSLERMLQNAATMVKNVFDIALQGGADFQLTMIRLVGLVQREMAENDEAPIPFSQSLGVATEKAKELSYWISELGIESVFKASTISDSIALAMSYDFTTEKAKELTAASVNFATGMGLTDERMRRIIENFGQMKAAGKITGTELRDLARGAFLPINAVMETMYMTLKKTAPALVAGVNPAKGLKEQMQKLVTEGAVPIEAFFDAFIAMSNTDFPNAVERASNSWQVVTSNVEDFVESVLGWRLITPVLDKLSPNIARFVKGLIGKEAREKFSSLGVSLADLTDRLMLFSARILPAEKVQKAMMKIVTGLDLFAGALHGIKRTQFLDKFSKFLKDDLKLPEASAGKTLDFFRKFFSVFDQIIRGEEIDWKGLGKAFSNMATSVYDEAIKPQLDQILINAKYFFLITLPNWWQFTASPIIKTFIEDTVIPGIRNWWYGTALPKIAQILLSFTAMTDPATVEKSAQDVSSSIRGVVYRALNDQTLADLTTMISSFFKRALAAGMSALTGGLSANIAISPTMMPDRLEGVRRTSLFGPIQAEIDALEESSGKAMEGSFKKLLKYLYSEIPGIVGPLGTFVLLANDLWKAFQYIMEKASVVYEPLKKVIDQVLRLIGMAGESSGKGANLAEGGIITSVLKFFDGINNLNPGSHLIVGTIAGGLDLLALALDKVAGALERIGKSGVKPGDVAKYPDMLYGFPVEGKSGGQSLVSVAAALGSSAVEEGAVFPETMQTIMGNVFDKVSEGFGKITSNMKSFIDPIIEKLDPELFRTRGEELMQALFNGMIQKILSSLASLAGMTQSIADALASGTNKDILAQAGSDLAQSFIDAFYARLNSVNFGITTPSGGTVTDRKLEEYEQEAGGGRVIRGNKYLVGERAFTTPEYFVPSRSGYVLNRLDAQRVFSGAVSPSSSPSGSSPMSNTTIIKNYNLGVTTAASAQSVIRKFDNMRNIGDE